MSSLDTTRMLIVPFEVVDRDPRAVWLGEAAAVLLSDALRAMQLPALTRDAPWNLYEVPDPAPRAMFLPAAAARMLEPAEMHARWRDGRFSPRRQIMLPSGSARPAVDASSPSPSRCGWPWCSACSA